MRHDPHRLRVWWLTLLGLMTFFSWGIIQSACHPAQAATPPRFEALAQQENNVYRLTLYRVWSSCFVLVEGKAHGYAGTTVAIGAVSCPH